jgi:hypothetical protein
MMVRETEARLRDEIKILDATIKVLRAQLVKHLSEKPPTAPWPLVQAYTESTRLWWDLNDRWKATITKDEIGG